MKKHRRILAWSMALTLTLPAIGQSTNDVKLASDVTQTLSTEAALKDMTITATAHNGTVTLTGHVSGEAARILASNEAGQVNGVKTVLNNLVVDAAPSSKPPATPEATTKTVHLPAHSILPVRLEDTVSTQTAKAGDMFHATVNSAIYTDGYPIIPAGTPVLGRVVEAKAAGRLVGMALLTVELVSMRMPMPHAEAQDLPLTTSQLSTKVAGRGGSTAAKAGGGAALGAVIGALAGGGTGAAIGGLSGAALGTGTNALRPGQQVNLRPETLLRFETTDPTPITIEMRDGKPLYRPAAPGKALMPRPSTEMPQ
jgi:BON domain